MNIFEKKEALKQFLAGERKKKKSIGFVPTMGALHEGHLSLIDSSKKENDLTVCSIFVNPTQFNSPEDLKKYPRTIESDSEKLKAAGCDALFIPGESEMYPPGDPENNIQIDLGNLGKVMEAKFRPGHFEGVVTVVNKLFNIVTPHKAYFGEKDYQQLLVILKMATMLKHPVEIVPCPTVREKDGLAMSSRNMRLSETERKAAPFIYKILCALKEIKAHFPLEKAKSWAGNKFIANKNFRLEYFEISDAETLVPLKQWEDAPAAVVCVAAYLGQVRLIDNVKI